MSGNTSILTSSCSEKLNQTCSDYLERVMNIWTDLYGQNDAYLNKRLEKLEANLEEFWRLQIQELENTKQSLVDSIESLGKQALSLEKALGLETGLDNIEDIPLGDLEEQLWKLLESYSEMKEKRRQEFNELKEKEKHFCLALDENCQLADATLKTVDERTTCNVPGNEDMARAAQRVAYLEGLMNQLTNDFVAAKEELNQLLEECEVRPLSKAERFARSLIGEDEFSCTKKNYTKLIEHLEKYRSIKTEAALQSNHLREQISSLWTKMLKNERELEEFLDQHEGFKKSVIVQLGRKLQELKTERIETLKELILKQRCFLDDLWTQCKYTDDQRNQFQAYHANCFTEKVLDDHEEEVERIKQHYDNYKRIYRLAEKYFELWQRLLDLEDTAKQTDRLFKNRGGKLLLEEKERRVVQKKLPAIKEDLVKLLHQYRDQEGNDFLYLGVPLLNTLEDMEEERQASKENKKIQRKAANVENILSECRLGARPVTAGCKRKLLTPQHPNLSTKIIKVSTSSPTNSVSSSKSTPQDRHKMQRNAVDHHRRRRSRSVEHTFTVPRTPNKTPATTHANGSPTYESFQEHIGTVCKEECLSSTIDPSAKCPFTENQIGKTKTPSKTKTPCKTSRKTPYQTPTKTPFRIATGSKIPSIIPPISPKSASKSTNRTKLPIIF